MPYSDLQVECLEVCLDCDEKWRQILLMLNDNMRVQLKKDNLSSTMNDFLAPHVRAVVERTLNLKEPAFYMFIN